MMRSKINFQILIATMHRENFDFLYAMFPHHSLIDLDIIVVNQTTSNTILSSERPTIKVINSFERGLSKSRNLALQHATSDWCLIADDDLVYLKDFEKQIENGFTTFPNSGLIVFQVESKKHCLHREYPEKSILQLNAFQKLNICSVEMLINRRIIYNKVVFNEYFGLGSQFFNSGEECVFINDIEVKTNKSISFYKEIIVQHPSLSTGNKYGGSKWYFNKGGVFTKVFPKSFHLWMLIQILFDIKQGKMKINTIFKVYKEMIIGSVTLGKINQ
ncbi:MAG: glycosyltransferase family 2 protein [Flavobacteriaceae bacterium]|nr:glycosyltransferase family 2 protein [Flavobacteriaceae bacterium]